MANRIEYVTVFFAGVISTLFVLFIYWNVYSYNQRKDQLGSMGLLHKAQVVLLRIADTQQPLPKAHDTELREYLTLMKYTTHENFQTVDEWGAPLRISVAGSRFILWSTGKDGKTETGHDRHPICDFSDDLGITNDGFITWVYGTGPYELTKSQNPWHGFWQTPDWPIGIPPKTPGGEYANVPAYLDEP